jgi:DNA adenine methylase
MDAIQSTAHEKSATTGTRAGRDGSTKAKPFVKWAGGKRQLLPAIRLNLPKRFARYFEPFVGGGAVFFDLEPPCAILSDANAELINCYLAVRDHVDELIRALRGHVYDKEHYYRVRAIPPETLGEVERAARTIFLNKTGFNGLYRVNSKGVFNVPFGRYVKPNFCDVANLLGCSARLKGAEISRRRFEQVLDEARAGDFVYFDPPYIPLSRTSSFTAYSDLKFEGDDHERLACVFEELARRGVHVMLSNSDVAWVRKRYARFRVTEVLAMRQVNSVSSSRGLIGELLVTSY